MNNKPRLLALTLCAFLVTAFSAPALAQENLAKFIEYYNGIEVRLQGKSAECGIKDPSRYEATLDRALKLVPPAPDTVDETIGYLVSNFEQARR